MSWAARNLAAYLVGGVQTTEITPNTGSLTTTGQTAHVRPIHGNAAALTLTGQAASVRQNIRITPNTGALTLTGQQAASASQSQIISKEYVGNGAPTRSFSSAGFIPLFVVVIGKDGSGNVVGALKSLNMPSGKSQPFQVNVDSAAASRANRILSIDLNGFTVGPDLNVNGRAYSYIMFPAGRFGAVTAGSYTGAAETTVGHGALSVSANAINGQGPGATQFVRPSDCERRWYRPAGSTVYTPGTPLILAGRRMIRTSDGAVLAETAVGGFVNSSSCAGIGYIIGSETAWYWEEQYIELNTLVPDMLLLMVDDDTGVFVPATIIPPPNVVTTNHSWDGSGGGALFCLFNSNTESVLHIFDEPGGTAYNLKDKLYHWLALKGDGAGSGGVRIKTFQYTGTGDQGAPIDFTGCGFDPEWSFMQGGDDLFHWSKRAGSTILGTNVSRRWIDGTGDHILVNPEYTITFITDGVRLPATNSAWNVLGREYTITCIGVAAPAENTQITPQTGSLIITPRNPIRAQKRLIRPNTALQMNLQGRASKTKETHTPGPPPKVRKETPDTGELQITGRQPRLVRSIRPLAGALAATGQRCFVRPPDFLALPQTGALSLTGQQPKQRITITPGTGALALNGQAAILDQSVPPRRTINTANELTLTASQPILKTSIIPNTGELQLPGFNTEPIVETNVTKITPLRGTINFLGWDPIVTESGGNVTVTPNTGALTLTGQQPKQKLSVFPNTGQILSDGEQPDETTEFFNVPFVGSLVLTGYQPTVRISQPGDQFVTPDCGSLILTGQPCIVQQTSPTPPIPPGPGPLVGGGIGLPTPRKLPFWPKTIITMRGRIVEPAAGFHGRLRVEENEWALFDD